MGIDVALVNERHEPLQTVGDWRQCVARLASGKWFRMSGSVCLRFVDPSGDAVFNQSQLADLLSELEQSAGDQTDTAVAAHIEKICELVRQGQGMAHMYIKFIGD